MNDMERLKMKHKRVTLSDVDGYVREQIFGEQSADSAELKVRLIRQALFENATPKQRRYLIMYYRDKMTMDEIATACGVAKSTVSRTVARGRSSIIEGLKHAELKRLIERIDSEEW